MREAPLAHAKIHLRDGRQLTYSAAGAASGPPVFYLHGAIGSPRWRTPQLDSLIAALGIRYLVVNRPGFSGSDPSPGRSVAAFADDIRQLADALGYQRFSVVGVSAGAPYALACAWALGDRVIATAAVSPLGPPSGSAASRALRYRVPLIALRAPGAGRLFAEAALRILGLRRATAPEAMIEDFQACRRHWGFDPEEIGSRVMLWHGATDRLVPKAHALRLAAAIPNCATMLTPSAGHFFYSRQLPEIIAPLVAPQLPTT